MFVSDQIRSIFGSCISPKFYLRRRDLKKTVFLEIGVNKGRTISYIGIIELIIADLRRNDLFGFLVTFHLFMY
jgi:hypothetical protein